MKFPIFTTAVAAIFLVSCGGGGGSSDSSQAVDEIPVTVEIDNVSLTAGVPRTMTIIMPKPPDPYQEITIDIGRTLAEANIIVTPQ